MLKQPTINVKIMEFIIVYDIHNTKNEGMMIEKFLK